MVQGLVQESAEKLLSLEVWVMRGQRLNDLTNGCRCCLVRIAGSQGCIWKIRMIKVKCFI